MTDQKQKAVEESMRLFDNYMVVHFGLAGEGEQAEAFKQAVVGMVEHAYDLGCISGMEDMLLISEKALQEAKEAF